MSIDYNKLFNPEDVKNKGDVSKIDAIIEFEEILFAISETIINYRKEHNLTQEQLAKKLKYSQPMIAKLERGDYNPTFKQIYDISQKLTNTSNMFIEILNNIEEKLNKLLVQEYSVKVNTKSIEKSYTTQKNQNNNIIIFSDYNNKKIGGKLSYEEYTSPIPDAG